MATMRYYEGQVVADRYRLRRYLAEGGFGAVFRADQLAYGVHLREVAVKVAKRPMDDAEAREVFGDALLLARLTESITDSRLRGNFVPIYDAGICSDGELRGHPYVVMQLVNGGSLGKLLRRGAFPLQQAMDYFDQILAALSFMHGDRDGEGEERPPVIHRDLKPDNVLVTRNPTGEDIVAVTDFGLAVELDEKLGWKESQGDLAYMAPESFADGISSAQTDVYMLGLVFYEMLTNHRPFGDVGKHIVGSGKDSKAELRRCHLNARRNEPFRHLEEHTEIRSRPELARVIRDALHPEPATRPYRDATDLLEAWNEAKDSRIRVKRVRRTPWGEVRRLLEAVHHSRSVGEDAEATAFLEQAATINRDPSRVPDHEVVGSCYLQEVELRVHERDVDGAGRVAQEGLKRRECRSTLLGMARYFEAAGSPAAGTMRNRAETCEDDE